MKEIINKACCLSNGNETFFALCNELEEHN